MVFVFDGDHTKVTIRVVSGKQWLKDHPQALLSEVASCLLFNCMDILQDMEMVLEFVVRFLQAYLFRWEF